MRVKRPLRVLSSLVWHRAPIEAQLIVTRRCNLSCGYCTEYDDHSPEVPFETLRERIDALHRLRVINIAMLGGEPLLHPRIADVIAYADRHAQVSMTTNAFLLSDKLIDDLNDSGLANLQVSIDAARPDPTQYIQKTLKPLRPKLDRLAARARFDVHCTVVLTPGGHAMARQILDELRVYPFFVSLNLMHGPTGEVVVDGPEMEALWNEHMRSGRSFSMLEEDYGRRLLRGERPDWHCRAGRRFLYVDEHGMVNYCSAQMGRVGKPVTQYGPLDLAAHGALKKGCEKGCSILCTYRDSLLDNQPVQTVSTMLRAARAGLFGGKRATVPAVGSSPPIAEEVSRPKRHRLPVVPD